MRKNTPKVQNIFWINESIPIHIMKLFLIPLMISSLLTVSLAQAGVESERLSKSIIAPIIKGETVHVSGDRPARLHWEPMIAADPQNPKNLLACWVDGEQGSKPDGFVVVYSSFDGGRTWQKTLEISHPDGGQNVVVDPTCAFGPGGAAYASALFRGKPIFRSTDSGKTWTKILELGMRGWDREYLTVDNTKGKGHGHVYYHYGSIIPKIGGKIIDDVWGIDIWRSDNSGLRFNGPARLISNGILGIGNGTVLSDGTFFAILSETSEGVSDLSMKIIDRIVVVRAGDDKAFSSAVTVSDWTPIGSIKERITCGPLPTLATDTSVSAFKDRLYAVWPDRRSGAADILVSISTDKGATWSTPKVVNDSSSSDFERESRNCTPAVAVNSSGVVGVVWYDSRKDAKSNQYRYHTRFSASFNGGETFVPSIKLSDERSVPKTFRIGETIGLDAGPDGKFHALWIENRTGNPQVYYAPITVTNSTAGTSAKISSPCKDKDLKDKIYAEELLPRVRKREVLDWVEIEKQYVTKQGSCGREAVWKTEPLYYFYAKDWSNYQKSLSQYIRTYGTNDLTPWTLNNYAWAIFQNVGDEAALEEASEWSLKSVQLLEGESEAIDTHANILHRLGRTKEAIGWMEKAVASAKTEPEKKRFQATIDKMKRGEPTWP